MISYPEKRRAERVNLNNAFLNICLPNVENREDNKGKICDLSSLGVKFVSYKPYIEDSKVELGLILPKHGTVANISASVRRCEPRDGESFYTALEFQEDYFQQSLVKNYIRVMKLYKKSLQEPALIGS